MKVLKVKSRNQNTEDNWREYITTLHLIPELDEKEVETCELIDYKPLTDILGDSMGNYKFADGVIVFINQYLDDGNKISAIKTLRTFSYLGLKEAKDAIDIHIALRKE